MMRPGFAEGVVVAMVATVAASFLHTGLSLTIERSSALHWTITVLSWGYLCYLLARSEQRVGRGLAPVTWLSAAALLWLVNPATPWFVLGHAGLLWLVRALRFCSGVVVALADLGIALLGLAAAAWAALETGSVFLSVWTLFLVQALFGSLPPWVGGLLEVRNKRACGADVFERAHQAAEAALRNLSSIR